MNDRFHAAFRWGTRTYATRPPSACRAARAAWDHLTAKHGPVRDLKLGDGYWMALTVSDGDLVDMEAVVALRLSRRRYAGVDGSMTKSRLAT